MLINFLLHSLHQGYNFERNQILSNDEIRTKIKLYSIGKFVTMQVMSI